jgi:uracil-DNA glycosylase
VLRLLVGTHAQAYYLPGFGTSRTDRVQRFREAPAGWFPLPHPSWRVNGWLKRNAWFAADVLPALRRAVHALL